MNQQRKNIFFNAILALCTLGAVLGCAASDSGNSHSTSTSEAYTVEHWKLMKEFGDNEVAANAKYAGKRVIVTGPLDFVKVENGKIEARFSVPATSYLQLFCEFADSESSAVGELKSGQQVSFEGVVRGIVPYGRLVIDDCSVR